MPAETLTRASSGSSAGEDARGRLLSGIPVSERRLRLAGVSTAVLEGGDGPPVILLHGPGGYAAHWLRVIPDLVTTHRVIAPDLPDHGGSQLVDGQLDAGRVFRWLGELIERTCPAPPVLVGHLVGGAIAARFAIDHGARLRRLVLVDTFGLAAFEPAPDFGLAMREFLGQPTQDTHDRFWQHCSHDLAGLREQMGERWEPFQAYNVDRARTPRVQAAMGALMGEFGVPQIPAAELARVTVPTTLIWGRHDRATPLRIAEAASARHGWPLHVIDDAADDPTVDQPAAFLAALRAASGSPRPVR
jgi:pimeloyl-ACP methyl ester carboxylesterase